MFGVCLLVEEFCSQRPECCCGNAGHLSAYVLTHHRHRAACRSATEEALLQGLCLAAVYEKLNTAHSAYPPVSVMCAHLSI